MFSFSETSCLTKAEQPSLLYYLPIAGERIIGFIPFPRVLVLCEMQSVSSRLWIPLYIHIYIHIYIYIYIYIYIGIEWATGDWKLIASGQKWRASRQYKQRYHVVCKGQLVGGRYVADVRHYLSEHTLVDRGCRYTDLVGCVRVPVAVVKGRLTWIPGNRHSCRVRQNQLPRASGEMSSRVLTLLGGARFIAWRLRRLF